MRRRRLHANPLRILDSKNPALQDVIAAAPRLIDALGADSRAHFDALRALLDEAGIGYVVNPRLVRGLDYYNRTVFEWVTDALGAQGTVAGGGRYDGLFEAAGRQADTGVRLRDRHRADDPAAAGARRVARGGTRRVRRACRRAAPACSRAASPKRCAITAHAVVLHAGGGSFKSQMKKADASGARLA